LGRLCRRRRRRWPDIGLCSRSDEPGKNVEPPLLTDLLLQEAICSAHRCLLISVCSTYLWVRLRAPRIANPTGHQTSPPSPRKPARSGGWTARSDVHDFHRVQINPSRSAGWGSSPARYRPELRGSHRRSAPPPRTLDTRKKPRRSTAMPSFLCRRQSLEQAALLIRQNPSAQVGVGLRGEIGLVAIFPKQARFRTAGVESRPARPYPKKGGRDLLQVIEVPWAGLPQADRGRTIQATGGKLAFRASADRPARPRSGRHHWTGSAPLNTPKILQAPDNEVHIGNFYATMRHRSCMKEG
jgi:hypothetical protein